MHHTHPPIPYVTLPRNIMQWTFSATLEVVRTISTILTESEKTKKKPQNQVKSITKTYQAKGSNEGNEKNFNAISCI